MQKSVSHINSTDLEVYLRAYLSKTNILWFYHFLTSGAFSLLLKTSWFHNTWGIDYHFLTHFSTVSIKNTQDKLISLLRDGAKKLMQLFTERGTEMGWEHRPLGFHLGYLPKSLRPHLPDFIYCDAKAQEQKDFSIALITGNVYYSGFIS